MFNLDQAISEWRRQMVAGGIKEPDDLNELESHLRDDVAQQVGEGVDAQQAFEAAVQRVGPAGVLTIEFKKVEYSRRFVHRKTMWCLIGLAFLSCGLAFGRSPAVGFAYRWMLAIPCRAKVTRLVSG